MERWTAGVHGLNRTEREEAHPERTFIQNCKLTIVWNGCRMIFDQDRPLSHGSRCRRTHPVPGSGRVRFRLPPAGRHEGDGQDEQTTASRLALDQTSGR